MMVVVTLVVISMVKVLHGITRTRMHVLHACDTKSYQLHLTQEGWDPGTRTDIESKAYLMPGKDNRCRFYQHLLSKHTKYLDSFAVVGAAKIP